jgi:tetratricopeptide (TPR) repeat protein
LKRFTLVALFLSTLASTATLPHTGFAQTPKRPVRAGQDADFEMNSQIAEAMRYLSVEPARALEILRRLDRQYPGRDRVLSRMGYVLQVMGEADSAAVCFQRALKANPASLESGKALGMLYISSDRDRDAAATFDALLRANNHDMNAYRTVGTALREVGRYDQALEVYRRGRDQSARHYQLSLEIADILETLGDRAGALDEYLLYVGDEGRNYRYARTRILDLMRDADEATRVQLAGLLESRLQQKSGNHFAMLDILASHYVEAGLLEQALDKALLADQEGPSDGAVLISLAERVLGQAEVRPRDERRRYLELGIRALDAFSENHPRAAGTDRARYMLATIYAQFGSGAVDGLATVDRVNYLEQAVAEFTDLSKRYPNSEFAERAYLDRGDLLIHRLKRPEDALEAYRSGAVNSRRYSGQFAARIGDLYLGLGRTDEAERYFESLIRSGVPELAQAGTYYTGVRLCLAGKYDAARDTLTYLAEEVPSSPYTNDAIENAWIIQEAQQFQSSALETYFDARRCEMAGDTASAVTRLEEIVAKPPSEPLRPRALFKLGRTLYESGDLDGAVGVLSRFLAEYPDDDLRPDVQRQVAVIYEDGYEQYDRALREYEGVLLNYPDYAFLDEVREDVRRLRSIVHGEEHEN